MTLADAVRQLYATFPCRPAGAGMDACDHCVGQDEIDELVSVERTKLTCAQIGRYAFRAMTTWGGTEDYRHYLPRILELAATPEGRGWPGLDFDLIADKLELAGWRSWHQRERLAVTDYLATLWDAVLDDDTSVGPEASDLLPMIARIADDVSVFLEAWAARGGLEPALQLAGLVESTWADMANTGHLGARWRGAPGQEVVEIWLLEPDRAKALFEAFESNVEHAEADRLAAAVDALGWAARGVR